MLWGLLTPLLVPPLVSPLHFTQTSCLSTNYSPSSSAPNFAQRKLLPARGPQAVLTSAQGMWTKEVPGRQVPLCPQLPRTRAWLPPVLPHGLWTGQGCSPHPLAAAPETLPHPGDPQGACQRSDGQ